MPRGRSGAWLAIIVVVGLVLRLGLLAAQPHPYENSGLSLAHGEMARAALDQGRWFQTNLTAERAVARQQLRDQRLVDPQTVDYGPLDATAQWRPQVLQPVGQGVVLAGIWKATGDQRYIYLQALQALLDALAILLVFFIARTLYGRERAALLAAGLYALFLPIAVTARIAHLDIWGIDFTLAIVALMLVGLGDARSRPGALVAAGLVTGAGVYFRPGLLLLPLGLALAAVAWIGWRRAAMSAAIPLIIVGLLLTPWIVRNEHEFGRFIPTRTGIGQNLWEGLGEVNNDFGAVLDDAVTARQVQRRHPNLRYGTPEYDDVLRTWAVDAIQEQPAHFAKVVARRVAITTFALHNFGLPFGLFEPLLFLLAVAAALWTVRRYGRQHLLLLSVVLATILPYLVLHVEPRYVLPASFVYLIWVALAADLLLESRGSRRHESV